MNYTEANMNCVCETPRGSIPVPKTPTAEPPNMKDQLTYLNDVMGAMFGESNRLCVFLCGHGIPYDKREDNTLTAYLAWVYRSVQLLNDKLREMNQATGAM